MAKKPFYKCVHCDSWVNPVFGEDSPAEHQGNEGTRSDPRAPGDHTNCCDECCYGQGLCKAAKRD